MLLYNILFYATLLSLSANAANSSNVIFCYWGTWSNIRKGNGQFKSNDINPNLCTHIGYAFFGLDDDGKIKSLRPQLDFDLGNIAKTVALKQVNSNLKVLASIGGGSVGSRKFSAMASTALKRANFIDSVLEFLQQNKLDGLDVDWEYPTQRGGTLEDRENFVSLLSELKEIFKAHKLLLTIAVAAPAASARISYDIPEIAKHIDLINVMTYDFAGAWKNTTGFNAPLKGPGNHNGMAAINYWLQSGAPANKLVMGLAFYGRSFTLANTTRSSPGAPVVGAGYPGPLVRSAGVLIYTEICEYLKTKNWTRFFDDLHLVPFAVSGDQWVGYDDEESLNYKIALIKWLNLAGAMIWSIDFDDFRGVCGQNYPLLRAVNVGLKNKTIS